MWVPLVFEKVGRSHAKSCGKLPNGATLRFHLVPLNSDYGIDADPGFVGELLLGQELTLASFSYLITDLQHGEHCSETPS